MGRTPDFFLVGAPKCGTTAMHEYLKAHPEVFVPDRKEPHHFGRDIRSPRFINDRSEYLGLFDKARQETAVGEASGWYLSSLTAAEEIREFEPDAKILVMLRNPVELIRSLHTHNVANGIQDILDLEAALDAGTDRFRGRIVGRPALPQFLEYLPIAHFADQLARFQAVFPPERIHVVIYEEFAKDPGAAFQGVLEFLGVRDVAFRPSFERHNPARRSKSRYLARWLNAPPPGLQRAVRRLVPGAVRRRLWHRGIKSAIYKVNTEPAPSPPMSDRVRERLRREYASDVRRTAGLIGRPDIVALWGFDDVAPEPAHVERTPAAVGH